MSVSKDNHNRPVAQASDNRPVAIAQALDNRPVAQASDNRPVAQASDNRPVAQASDEGNTSSCARTVHTVHLNVASHSSRFGEQVLSTVTPEC